MQLRSQQVKPAIKTITKTRIKTKDEAMELFSKTRAEYLTRARKVAQQIVAARSVKTITVDDVRKVCPVPKNINPSVLGALFCKSDWVIVGFEQSTRAVAHSRFIRRYTPIGVNA